MIEGDMITFDIDGLTHDAKILKVEYTNKKFQLEIEIINTYDYNGE